MPSAENDVPKPKWSDLFGIDPDYVPCCSVDWIRYQRGAEQPDEFEHAECYARVFPPGTGDPMPSAENDTACPIGAVPPETAARRGCAPWDFHDGPGCEVHGPAPIPPGDPDA